MQYILSIIVPLTLIYRVRRNPRGAIVNPLFYLLTFAYLYLLIPNFYIDYVIYDVYSLPIDKASFRLSQIICQWHVLIFFLYYIFSKDAKIALSENRPYIGVYQISFFIYALLTFLFLFIILKEIPAVWALRGNREEALGQFYSTVQSRYKLAILNYIMFGVTTVVVWKKRNLMYLIPLLLICIMDISHGGRTMIFMVFIYCYMNIVLFKNKLYLQYAIAGVVTMIMIGLLQRTDVSNLLWSLYMAGAEFSNTRVTTAYIIDTPQLQEPLLQHMAIAFLKTFPGGISNKIFSIPDGMWYGEKISAHLGLNFGLAGNIATEAIYYGGIPFGFISPLIIGMIYYALNYLRIYKNLVGLIFVLLLCAKTQDIMRMYFYENFFYLIQMLIFFLPFITFIEYNKRIIVLNNPELPAK